MQKQLIYDLDLETLDQIIIDSGEPKYRTQQVWEGVYKKYYQDPTAISNLPISFRNSLNELFSFNSLIPTNEIKSKDGETIKTLFTLPDGNAIEAVMMGYSNRRTLCISTQVGCAMGCIFCATGQMGLTRHLSSGEIIEQVIYYARRLQSSGQHITNVVVMGMGEPFHNYQATMEAIYRLNNPLGFNLGARRFTISTVGIVPAIQHFTNDKSQVNLAVSLHAADDNLRSSLVPINRKYPLQQLMDACQKYVESTNRRISFEWALIKGINDSITDAIKLSNLLQIFRRNGLSFCHVNIIPLNPTKKYNGYAASGQKAIEFKDELERRGYPCTIRLRRGIEIHAGCGQLAVYQNIKDRI